MTSNDISTKEALSVLNEWTSQIREYCLKTESTNPLEIAVGIMNTPGFPVAGQAHHPLVAGSLMAAYQNASKKHDKHAIETAIQRADKLPAGFCAAYGADAGAIAAGIVISVVFGNTVRAEHSSTRSVAHQLTAHCLLAISNNTGNRCCKRTVFQVLETASNFIVAYTGISLERPASALFKCDYASQNNLCNKMECRYYPTE